MGSCGNFLQKTCKNLTSCLSLAGVRKSTLATAKILSAVANSQNKTRKFAKRPPRVQKSLAVFLFVGKGICMLRRSNKLSNATRRFNCQHLFSMPWGNKAQNTLCCAQENFAVVTNKLLAKQATTENCKRFVLKVQKTTKCKTSTPCAKIGANGIALCGAMASKTKLFGICRGWKKYNEA